MTDYTQEQMDFALLEAVTLGHRGDIRRFLDLGANPNMRMDDGMTLLMHAAYHGMNDVAEMLLEKKADTALRFRLTENTALHYAVNRRNLALVEMMVKHGAQIDARNTFDETPLHRAATAGAKDICLFLLDKGANILARDSHRRTPAEVAALNVTSKSSPREYIETRDLLELHELEFTSKIEAEATAKIRSKIKNGGRFRLKP